MIDSLVVLVTVESLEQLTTNRRAMASLGNAVHDSVTAVSSSNPGCEVEMVEFESCNLFARQVEVTVARTVKCCVLVVTLHDALQSYSRACWDHSMDQSSCCALLG